MAMLPKIILGAIAVSLILSHKQIISIFSKIGSLKKSEPIKASSSESYDTKQQTEQTEDIPLPEPTPLYITPEQVKTYDDRPWRPFRWPYHQTMAIFKLDINHWLDMDKYYWHYIQEKERIYHTYRKQNIDWLPESEDACLELMEIVRDHMLKRYPLLFTSKDGVSVMNELTGEFLDMSTPLKEHPLIYVSKMAKEDFYLVLKRDDGMHYLVAAAVPFPGGSFGIDYKIGKHLDFIHTDVPYYEEKLKKSMEKWFAKMRPSDPVERASWYISWDHKLKVNNVYALKEDEKVDSSVEPTEFNVRIERQTLRRLPRSNAIIFTNHPIFFSIEEMKDEPMIPSIIKKIIFEAPEGIIKYKNFDKFRDHINNYLDELIERQIDLKIIDRDEKIKTGANYPFADYMKDGCEETGWQNPNSGGNYVEKAKSELSGDND